MNGSRIISTQQYGPLYTPAEFYLLRAPLLPSTSFFLLAEEREHQTDGARKSDLLTQEARIHLEQTLLSLTSRPSVKQGLAVASFSLLAGLASLTGDGSVSQPHFRRAFSSLLRYLIRMSTRPTPFGLFAGVAMGTFSDATTVSLGLPTQKKIHIRPDMRWLLSLVQTIEQTPELARQLHVILNQRVYAVGDKGFLPYADIYGQGDNRFISFDITPIMKYILENTRQPTFYTDVFQGLQDAFPDEPAEHLELCLWQLWQDHVLISTLHPPLTCDSPVDYIQEQLRHLKGADTFCTKLQVVLDDMLVINTKGMQGNAEDICTMAMHQEQLVSTTRDNHPPLFVDTALHVLSPEIHKSVGDAASLAAETLLRLTPSPYGPRHLYEYRLAFEEKFGDDAEVPLCSLLTPELGLDAPTGYRRPVRTYPLTPSLPPSQTRKRDAFLCALVTEAVNERSLEVELTETHLQKLERWKPNPAQAPLSLEIHLQIHAASRLALDQGDWNAIVSPSYGASAAGSSIARFLHLEESENRQRMQRFLQDEEALSPSAIFAELSYQPWYGRAANIALRPLLRSYEICVGTTPTLPPDRVITLDDLVVGVRNERFYLRSLRLKKQVIVSQSHMLTSEVAPNLCRFLAEIAQDGSPLLFPFDWGIAAGMPFLPRVRQGRVVFSPAQWNLRPSALSALHTRSQDTPWFLLLQQWRAQWRVPRYIYLSNDDNRLLLDLENPIFAEELHTELTKIGDDEYVSLQEVLPDFDHLWLQDQQGACYFSEIVVPLLLRGNSVDMAHSKGADAELFQFSQPVTSGERLAFPGGDWVYIKLFVSSRLQNPLIAGPLRQITQRLLEEQMIDRWFFIRYSDPESHLRLRLHVHSSETARQVLDEILQWSQLLVKKGIVRTFSFDTYVREVERYGGPRAIDTLEDGFTANSITLSSLIALQQTPDLPVDLLALAVFSLDQFLMHWGLDEAQRLAWVQWRTRNYGKYEFKKEFHQQRRVFCDLLDVRNNTATVLRKIITSAVSTQENVLKDVSVRLDQLAHAGQLWSSKNSILNNLLHMHINRLLGASPGQERKIYAFWRYTLESIHGRMKNETS